MFLSKPADTPNPTVGNVVASGRIGSGREVLGFEAGLAAVCRGLLS
jgi:hypothetical protein